jgi:hypothetical protein
MNASLLRSLAASAALLLTVTPQPSFAQTTATTTPVGFVTVAVAGTGGTTPVAYTFTCLGILNPVAWQSTISSITTTTLANDTIVDNSAAFVAGAYNSVTVGTSQQPTYFVEILSGNGAGEMYDIASNTATTLTFLNKSLNTLVTTDFNNGVILSYAIRPHMTLGQVFGAAGSGPSSGLQGGISTTADQVQLFRNGGYSIYYYQIGGRGSAQNTWVLSGSPNTDASATVIYPTDGIAFARFQSSSVNVVVSGAVKTGQTQISVNGQGYTLLGNVYSAGMTLGTSGLYTDNTGTTGVLPGISTTADQVMFWNPTATPPGFNIYYYQVGGRGSAQNTWVLSGSPNTDASTTPIPVGTALFILRSGAPFTWVAPQFPASFN